MLTYILVVMMVNLTWRATMGNPLVTATTTGYMENNGTIRDSGRNLSSFHNANFTRVNYGIRFTQTLFINPYFLIVIGIFGSLAIILILQKCWKEDRTIPGVGNYF